MEKFAKKISETTIPLILYLLSSFLIVFVSTLHYVLIVAFLFLLISSVLFDQKTLQKIIIISVIVISIVLFLSMLLALNFSYKMVLLNLPKSISLSIMITSTIAFFVYLPSIQLLCIAKKLTRSEYPAIAILAGFRAFPVFFNFSKRIFITIRIRKAYSSYFDFIILYIQNIIVDFLNFLDDFIKRYAILNIRDTKIELSLNYKTYISLLYLLTTIIFIIYEK